MANAVEQAQREREVTKQALEAHVAGFERKVRAELDWKSRLRNDGPRYAAIAGAATTALVGSLLLRRVMFGGKKSAGDPEVTSLDDIAQELKALRKLRTPDPLWHKLATRVASAAGAAAATYVAREFMSRFGPPERETEE